MINKYLIGGLIALTAISAQAKEETKDSMTFGMHLGSIHDRGDYNNVNPGLYVRSGGWTGGIYRNSLRKTSIYGGYTFDYDTPSLPLVKTLSLTVGVVSGYPNTIKGSKLSLMLAPSAKIPLTEETSLRLTVLPRFKAYNQATAYHFSIEKSF